MLNLRRLSLLLFVGLALVQSPARALVHPGIGLNKEQLATIVANVRGGVEPWKSWYDTLTARDHRFSKKPWLAYRSEWNPPWIDGRDFDDRCQWDSETSFCQSVMYLITGEDIYRENALKHIRPYIQNVRNGRPHWDSQFRWPYAERWLIMALELLRYTGPKTGPLAWTQEDTDDANAMIAVGENMWWGRGMYLNQLQWAVGGPLNRAIWRDDADAYAEMVEIVMSNKGGPVGEGNGSVREMCRLVVTNEVDGVPVKPHMQFTEMGRDIGHPFPGFGALCGNLAVIRSQGTKVDPKTGEVSTKRDAVDPFDYLGCRALRGANEICKYNLGFDIDWTPMYINRGKKEAWRVPSNWGGGRGRIVDSMDIAYLYYRWVKHVPFEKSEQSRYFGYANRLRGPNLMTAFFWMPAEAAGQWADESFNPGRDNTLRFAEFIREPGSPFAVCGGEGAPAPRHAPLTGGGGTLASRHAPLTGGGGAPAPASAAYLRLSHGQGILPIFLWHRYPLPKPGEYTLRYRADGESMMGTVDPEDYQTEFENPVDLEHPGKRHYVERINLPATGSAWKDYTFTLAHPPGRNLIKLAFATKGKHLDLATLRGP